eukprot:jgi/Chlat1/1731/Chrsp13S02152
MGMPTPMQTRRAARRAAWEASLNVPDDSCKAQVLDNSDLLHAIFSTLSPIDLATARCVNKAWSRTAVEAEVAQFQQRWPSREGMLEPVRECYKLFNSLPPALYSDPVGRCMLFCTLRLNNANNSQLLLVPAAREVAAQKTRKLQGGAFCLKRHRPLKCCKRHYVDPTRAALNAFAKDCTLELLLLRIDDGTLARVPIAVKVHYTRLAAEDNNSWLVKGSAYVGWHIYPLVVSGAERPFYSFYVWFNKEMMLRNGELSDSWQERLTHWSELVTVDSESGENSSTC